MHSEEEARLVHQETRRIARDAYERARAVLTASRDALDRVASALLERETITAVELEALAGPPTTTSSREILTGKAR
ncbi:MAG TPA: hypothetical protein VK988_02375 [Acidimicrobiales bacterium]|nr:hypothetical protein [Acidimicrobiales bacterium]